MKKISRKLLISVFTLAFALITLGATTFAWFTLSATVSVSEFDLNIEAGSGIEISVDGYIYRNLITMDDLEKRYDKIGETNFFKTLDAVTSPNGHQFYNLEQAIALQNSGSALPLPSGSWFELDLWFRSPIKNTKVVLGESTNIRSHASSWDPDVEFLYRGEDEENKTSIGTPIDIYASDSLRFSFQRHIGVGTSGEGENKILILTGPQTETYDISEKDADDNDISYGDVTVWELDGFGIKPNPKNENELIESNRTGHNLRLDSTLNSSKGLYRYWEAKGRLSSLPTEYDKLPIVYAEGDRGTNGKVILIITEGDASDGYYYGYLKARFWLEGFDPDNFDAQFNKAIQIALAFSAVPVTDPDPEP